MVRLHSKFAKGIPFLLVLAFFEIVQGLVDTLAVGLVGGTHERPTVKWGMEHIQSHDEYRDMEDIELAWSYCPAGRSTRTIPLLCLKFLAFNQQVITGTTADRPAQDVKRVNTQEVGQIHGEIVYVFF